MRLCLTLAIILTFASIASCIVAVALPYWLYNDSANERYQGLWFECQRAESNVMCEYKWKPPEFIDATRVTILFGLIFCIISVILGIVFACVKTEKHNLGVAAGILAFLGGLFMIIAVIVYVSKYTILIRRYPETRLYASFGLAVVAAVGAFISALTYCVAFAREEYDD